MRKANLIKIREISEDDIQRAQEFLEYFNSLVEEEAMICLDRKKNLEQEIKWLNSNLEAQQKKKKVVTIAEDEKNRRIVGIAEITLKSERQSHVGELGISVKKEYRGKGVGKMLLDSVLSLAVEKLDPKPQIIRLSVFSENDVAINLYRKAGFIEVAVVPEQYQYKGKKVDEIIMIKKV